MSDIEVTLIDNMGTDLSVVNAARVSFDKESDWVVSYTEKYDDQYGSIQEMKFNLNDADTKLIHYLSTHNHWSPFSHAFASFRIMAPIFVARQLVKHTVGLAWNEVSRRYVDSEPTFYLPENWRKRSANVKQGSSNEKVDVVFNVWKARDDHFPLGEERKSVYIYDSFHVYLKTYEDLLKQGVCPEQARMVLPQNTMTEWIWSGSLYAFARVCNLRLDSHTQKETQEVAKQISKQMKELFPVSWGALVNEPNN